MKAKRQLFRNPNRLLCDETLSYSARRVGTALYSHRNRLGQCILSLTYLARRASCSVPTVRKAVEELERAGYISHCKSLQYREEIGRVGYGRTTYSCLLSVTEDYTLLPREIFGWSLSHGAFCVCLCLFQQAGNADRAFPSIRRIGRLLGMGCATVCRALGAVRKLRAILVLRCKRRNRVFSSNSYYLKARCIGEVRRQAAAPKRHRGVLCSFFYSNSTAVHIEMQFISAHRDALIFYKQPRDLDNVGSYKRRKNYMAKKSAKKNTNFFSRESRSGERGDPPQRGERGEVTFSVSRPCRPALFGSPLALSISKTDIL
ncbi:MAG: helix-turn-helix domain-containing protein [Oscillibacter sp.]|nr:helix-turn-helix domain-containing protein [Oscillibacter sp.]MEA4993939.1 helix-turn-helix domain-containing protein [Oscillibacter sp.]